MILNFQLKGDKLHFILYGFVQKNETEKCNQRYGYNIISNSVKICIYG